MFLTLVRVALCWQAYLALIWVAAALVGCLGGLSPFCVIASYQVFGGPRWLHIFICHPMHGPRWLPRGVYSQHGEPMQYTCCLARVCDSW